MKAEVCVLGGAEEIGANCCYVNLDNHGILIDAGLHPNRRDLGAFPDLQSLNDRPTQSLLITHAHTDHMGGVPYVMRHLPHLRTYMTRATRDLSDVMLGNTQKLLKSQVTAHFTKGALEYYTAEQIALLRQSFLAVDYETPFYLNPDDSTSPKVTYHWAGHILGSAGVSIEHKGMRIVHTGDVQFQNQNILQRARFPKKHTDVLIMEATNGASTFEGDFNSEAKRLASFINRISNSNGSVLIPVFALGKMQEILGVIYSLIRSNFIPNLPIYTGGMGIDINKIYDQYCYTEPFKHPGFEISDIPQERIRFDTLFKAPYMQHPSIVLASSGMMNQGTNSFALGGVWLTKPNFGIAFIGYQDESSPGHNILHSTLGKPFNLAGRSVVRNCQIERLRFSAHATLEDLALYATDVTPNTVVIVHGSEDACNTLALSIRARLPRTRIIIPRKGVNYPID